VVRKADGCRDSRDQTLNTPLHDTTSDDGARFRSTRPSRRRGSAAKAAIVVSETCINGERRELDALRGGRSTPRARRFRTAAVLIAGIGLLGRSPPPVGVGARTLKLLGVTRPPVHPIPAAASCKARSRTPSGEALRVR
jgi:hypothetical protein